MASISATGTVHWAQVTASPVCAGLQAAANVRGDAYLVSPLAKLGPAAASTTLEFQHRQPTRGATADQLTVVCRTGTSGAWRKLATFGTAADTWTARTVKLPALSGHVQVAFLGRLRGGGGVFVDTVRWYRPGVLPAAPGKDAEPAESAESAGAVAAAGAEVGSRVDPELANESAPGAAFRAVLVPAQPTVLDEVRCVLQGPDPWRDGLTFVYHWQTGDGGALREAVLAAGQDVLPPGLAVAGTWLTCEVRTVDDAGDACADAVISAPVRIGGDCTFELDLQAGWNLASVPIVPDDPQPAAVFAAAAVAGVWAWDGEAYGTVTVVEAGRGYWVYASAPLCLTVRGCLPAQCGLSLNPGRNLVGPLAVPPYRAVALTQVHDPDGILQPLAWGWDGQSSQPVTELVPGRGYWLDARAAGSIRFDSAP